MIQSNSCYSCLHCIDTRSEKPGYPNKGLCEVTKRWGKLSRGTECERYEYRQRPNPIGSDGIPIKNKQPLDYRTAIQWLEDNRKVKPGAKGVIMHANSHSMRTYTYYLIEDTEPC